MNPPATENQPPSSNSSLNVGIPQDLVFDDNPLDALLYGAEPVAPTPASALELWEQGLDSSEACARAVAAVLVQNPDLMSKVRDLDAAEQCLKQSIKSQTATHGPSLAACWSSLGQLLELKNQKDGAERCYRQALGLREKAPGARPESIEPIAFRLVQLLENSNRHDEAKQLRNRFFAASLSSKEDDTSLWQLRATALEMFLAGQYAEAEAVYRRLVEKGFELGSTHCHLARVFLMTDREAEARQEMERAWAVQQTSSAYLLVRIQFLRTLLQMLAGEEWKPRLAEFKDALSDPGAHLDWTMQPVLDHLKPRLGPEQFELLITMLAAVCRKAKLLELQANPLWREICGGDGVVASMSKDSSSVPYELE